MAVNLCRWHMNNEDIPESYQDANWFLRRASMHLRFDINANYTAIMLIENARRRCISEDWSTPYVSSYFGSAVL